ncbi:PREDICTED: interstitial collagenase-like [Cyprinodon variegatus]|uniref:interstitial collagenase-like n=1 Tax=Cyprinodon variegatus TaxID=28743 RepID=UPI000742651E|nr:PREDICTED: interstitial collagenase-like [Cyprinodon variegatus]
MELLWMRNMVLVSLILVEISWTRPIDEDLHLTADDIELAKSYLRRFYSPSLGGKDLRSPTRRIRSSSSREQKIRQMQNFFGLRETGILDSETLDVMKKPRCGVPDLDNYSFYPYRPKWKNYTISYTITKYTSDMGKLEVEKAFRLALKMWSDAAPLSFIKVDHGKADIVLSFARRAHGDFSPFDGPGGVLAHAFQPGEGVGGDVHFDEDETWTTGMQGYNLFAVAAHEFGHSLGLTHSRDPSAVMFPNYRLHSNKQYALSRDDVLGIQMLYVFSGRKYWVVQQLKTRSTTGNISEFGLPPSVRQVDAAVHNAEYGKTIFFIGPLYYSYDENKSHMDPGFPRLTQTDWPGIPRRVDAAFKLHGSIFLLSGTKSYQYDFRQKRVVNIITGNSWLGC